LGGLGEVGVELRLAVRYLLTLEERLEILLELIALRCELTRLHHLRETWLKTIHAIERVTAIIKWCHSFLLLLVSLHACLVLITHHIRLLRIIPWCIAHSIHPCILIHLVRILLLVIVRVLYLHGVLRAEEVSLGTFLLLLKVVNCVSLLFNIARDTWLDLAAWHLVLVHVRYCAIVEPRIHSSVNHWEALWWKLGIGILV
jgi:hypothetical protein